MYIGIVHNFQHSFFSSGTSQTVVSLVEIFQALDHKVEIIRTEDSKDWWIDDILTDVSGNRKLNCVNAKDISGCIYDIVFEVGNNTLTKEERERVGKKHIWICRKIPILNDIEQCLYPISSPRDLEGISEIFVYEELAKEADIEYLELLYKIPVYRIPFSWTATVIEEYRNKKQSPIWQQIYNLEGVKERDWKLFITETNRSCTSSCTIPLCIAKEIIKKNKKGVDQVIQSRNMEHLSGNTYFKNNILSHLESDISGSVEMMSRQILIDWVYHPKSIVISHSRFVPYQLFHFDLLWVGIPFIHNNLLLKELEIEGYYSDNNIVEALETFDKLIAMDNLGQIEKVIDNRRKIVEKYHPYSNRIQSKWQEIFTRLVNIKDSLPLLLPLPEEEKKQEEEKSLRVGFCSMWSEFNAEYNMFILMLRDNYPDVEIEGIDIEKVEVGKEEIDVLIFGPFSSRWKRVREDIPKVHFTGENTKPINLVELNLGFKYSDHERYLRFPLWLLEIDWYGADQEKLQNPKVIPLERCCQVYPEDIQRKQKFCAFVVSNPYQEMRNCAFEWLSEYKKIDSAGRLFNNMGDGLFAGLGGGGGELRKFEFLKDYKFCLTYENGSSPGYTTEKYIHAKAAGCIPIYWGDSEFERDFDIEGCIDARNIKTKEELIKIVESVDKNPSEWLRKYSVPLLNKEQEARARELLKTCASRIYSLCKKNINIKGNKKTESKLISRTDISLDETVFVTASNTKFLPSLSVWIQAIRQQKQEAKQLQIIVYMMKDVKEEVVQEYKREYPEIIIRRFPEEGIEGFSDIWAPEHFAWKLWIYKEMSIDMEFRGKPIFYLDAGCLMNRWPYPWLKEVREKGMCVLDDFENKNCYYSSPSSVKGMKMTEEEMNSSQIWAGAISFIGGHPLPKKVFEEAWEFGKIREIIVGSKWISVLENKKTTGHRHDQTILSVITQRNGVPRMPIKNFYCDRSLRHSYLSGTYIYAHRGNFKIHDPIAKKIDTAWVINLARRPDRMEKFTANNPSLANLAIRVDAFDGLKLPLTPAIAKLFSPNDFKWKKSVMGCALSHLQVWMKLLVEKPDIESYLVLEDDVRLDINWKEKWERASDHLPENWDVVYLGGILPPNKKVFDSIVERVNEYIGKIMPNKLFGQKEPTSYFPFCAYGYVVSKRGVEKIISIIKARGGIYTSADHLMDALSNVLNIYFIYPLIAGCYQDDDPAYQNSQFDNFSRKDSFDSDLWNNTEHFTREEVQKALSIDCPLDFIVAFEDARKEVVSTVEVEEVNSKEEIKNIVSLEKRKKCEKKIINIGPEIKNIYEEEWLREIFGTFEIENKDKDSEMDDESIFLVQRGFIGDVLETLERMRKEKKRFYIFHLSDEKGLDPIYYYHWEECLGVVRNYVRADLNISDKICILPLGYHWRPENRNREKVLTWSFVGTAWENRREKLRVLEDVKPNKVEFMTEWNSPNMIKKEEMLEIIETSKFIPCPRGNNPECFRIYEALEGNAVPILVNEEGCGLFTQWIVSWLPIMVLPHWGCVEEFMKEVLDKPGLYESYKKGLYEAWTKKKEESKKKVREVFYY